MGKLQVLDLFSGIGGFSLGLEKTGGFETVAFCEKDEFCKKVLQKHWSNVKIYEDIKRLTYDKLRSDGINTIDIITGGYPCQPFSTAGSQKGEQDERHLWSEMFRLIKECRPTWVIGENVSGHIKLGLDSVLEDLESEGYATRTFSISASSIGANHKRERVWIIANSKRIRQQRQREYVRPSGAEKNTTWKTSWTFNESQGDKGWWELEPNVGRVAYGIPQRMDRLKSLGNSLIPHIPNIIGQIILRIPSAMKD